MKEEKVRKHWYNNGVNNKLIADGEPIPDGFVKGALPFTEEHKKKIGEKSKLKKVSDETKAKLSKARKGKKSWNSGKKGCFSEETIQKMRNKAIGRKASVETRIKLSKLRKGKKTWNTGKKMSKEYRQNNSLAQSRPEVIAKKLASRKRNNTVNTSKYEEYFNSFLIEAIGQNNFVRQYSEERYPFACDFYIPQLDLFIELNHCWTHGFRHYDKNDTICQEQLLCWQEKAKDSQFYAQAIDTWTNRDIIKYTTAQNNNLNYICTYTQQDLENLINYLKSIL